MVSRVNIAKVAKQNELSLRAKFDAMAGSHPASERVRQFFESCDGEWSVSINCWAFQLLFLLEQNLPYNKYRYVQHREGKVYLDNVAQTNGQSPVDWSSFWEVLQRDGNDAKFAPRRRAFNHWADKEEDFSYCAYYVGDGGGAIDFGEFSLIMKPELVRSMKEISFLLKDSLKDYLMEQPPESGNWVVDSGRIREEAATVATVTHLMCLKLNQLLVDNDIESCRSQVCTYDDYLEGQVVDPFTIDAIGVVRVAKPNAVRQKMLTDLVVQGRLSLSDDELTLDEQRIRDFHKSIARLQLQHVKIAYL